MTSNFLDIAGEKYHEEKYHTSAKFVQIMPLGPKWPGPGVKCFTLYRLIHEKHEKTLSATTSPIILIFGI